MQLFDRLVEVRARWNVLEHPFYVRWSRGELTREELSFYAGEYRHAVVALADAARAAGADHAEEERAHVALWDDFAAAVGAVGIVDPLPETRECVEAWTAARDALEGLVILYAVWVVVP